MILSQARPGAAGAANVVEAARPLWEKAAEFGVLAFLIVLFGASFLLMLWLLGRGVLRLLEKTIDRQANAVERTTVATEQTADAVAVIANTQTQQARTNEEISQTLQAVVTAHERGIRAARHITAAARAGLPDNPQVRQHLDAADRVLE